jgi:DNA-binding NarL/FixJ family response regulator
MAVLRVLIVEDHPNWQKILQAFVDRAMQNSGDACSIQVIKAFDDAWATLGNEGPWHLLVTDIGLGRSKPKQKLGKMLVERARYLQIPSIVVSGTPGLTKQDVRDMLLEYQAHDFFDKSNFDSDKFIVKVREILQGTRIIPRSNIENSLIHTETHRIVKPTAPLPSLEVFFSYAHKDEALRDKLVTHLSTLKRQGAITDWHDRLISPGAEWVGQIDNHLNAAGIILLLISPDFIASDYCYGVELVRAMERHQAGQARVIPIILRPVDWTGTPFSKLQALPKDGKPITIWANEDEAFLDVAKGLRRITEQVEKLPSNPYVAHREESDYDI